jgi:hypothetical protein
MRNTMNEILTPAAHLKTSGQNFSEKNYLNKE